MKRKNKKSKKFALVGKAYKSFYDIFDLFLDIY
jgi:hypothetical protein